VGRGFNKIFGRGKRHDGGTRHVHRHWAPVGPRAPTPWWHKASRSRPWTYSRPVPGQAPPAASDWKAPPLMNQSRVQPHGVHIRGRIRHREDPRRSFASLLRRNREDDIVFLRQVPDPINILPRVEWRNVGIRREILWQTETIPFWDFRTVRRIWRSTNPQIAKSRPIHPLRDSIITVKV
jgi:hypothetical protein